MGPEALQSGDAALAAWIAYGAKKAELYEQARLPPANQSADDFLLELGAREAQSAFWEQRRKEGAPPFALLDRQVEIWRAGLLPELVVLAHGRPGWTVPAARLSQFRFDEMLTKFPGDHRTNTPVALRPPSGKLVPDVPGADFPDPARLPLGAASCRVALDERAAAWARWPAIEAGLGGVPVAASSTIDFGRQLAAVRREPLFLSRGVTWVSDRVGYLAFLDGFCAIEAEDWPRAMSAMSRAVALNPGEASARLELALALTMVRRHEEALSQVNRALDLTDDSCTAALAWRRRGYVLYELGALDAARLAYEKSLRLEPGNAVALRELDGIAAALKGAGGNKEQRPFVAPPPDKMIVTKCHAPAPGQASPPTPP